MAFVIYDGVAKYGFCFCDARLRHLAEDDECVDNEEPFEKVLSRADETIASDSLKHSKSRSCNSAKTENHF